MLLSQPLSDMKQQHFVVYVYMSHNLLSATTGST